MATPHGPRRGSLQFWPRVKARKIYPKISYGCLDNGKISCFAGYKVGMVQYHATETRKNIDHGKEIIKFKCPICGIWGTIDEDQFNGRISIDCPNCEFHETINLKSELDR